MLPLTPPGDLDDRAVIRKRDGGRSVRSRRLPTTGKVPTGGRPALVLTVARLSISRRCSQLVKLCQAQLIDSRLDLVPPESLHGTLGRFGFVDEIEPRTARTAPNELPTVCGAVAEVILNRPGAMNASNFRPRLGLAYANDDVALASLFSVVGRLRELPGAPSPT